MSLFMCSNCGGVESTALSNFWHRGNGPALCSACDPEPVPCSENPPGTWHGKFEQRSADGMLVDEQGFLWSKSVVQRGAVTHTSMVAEVVGGELVPIEEKVRHQ